jgi:hypothetical protein
MKKNLFSKIAKAGFWYIALAVYALQAESKRRMYNNTLLNYKFKKSIPASLQ